MKAAFLAAFIACKLLAITEPKASQIRDVEHVRAAAEDDRPGTLLRGFASSLRVESSLPEGFCRERLLRVESGQLATSIDDNGAVDGMVANFGFASCLDMPATNVICRTTVIRLVSLEDMVQAFLSGERPRGRNERLSTCDTKEGQKQDLADLAIKAWFEQAIASN